MHPTHHSKSGVLYKIELQRFSNKQRSAKVNVERIKYKRGINIHTRPLVHLFAFVSRSALE